MSVVLNLPHRKVYSTICILLKRQPEFVYFRTLMMEYEQSMAQMISKSRSKESFYTRENGSQWLYVRQPSGWINGNVTLVWNEFLNAWMANLKVLSHSRVFAVLFKLFKWNWSTTIKISKNTRVDYHKSCSKLVNSFVYFESRDPRTVVFCFSFSCDILRIFLTHRGTREWTNPARKIQLRSSAGKRSGTFYEENVQSILGKFASIYFVIRKFILMDLSTFKVTELDVRKGVLFQWNKRKLIDVMPAVLQNQDMGAG